jgi:hypothetical protein
VLFFFSSSVLGLILAVAIDYKLSLEWYRSVLWFHVEFGIALAVVSSFHLFWHRYYYVILLKQALAKNKDK